MRAGINELEGQLWLRRKIREEAEAWVRVLALPLSHCVTLVESLAFSGLQFRMSGK